MSEAKPLEQKVHGLNPKFSRLETCWMTVQSVIACGEDIDITKFLIP